MKAGWYLIYDKVGEDVKLKYITDTVEGMVEWLDDERVLNVNVSGWMMSNYSLEELTYEMLEGGVSGETFRRRFISGFIVPGKNIKLKQMTLQWIDDNPYERS